jgi:hypothetical protein
VGIESAEEVDDGETEVEFYPRIEYEYTVDGTSYTNTRIYHPSQVDNEPGELAGKEFDQRGGAEAVVSDYTQGETATVYYDPAEPSFSYLRDPSGSILQSVAIIGVMGLLFGGIGLGGALGLVSLND